MIRFRDQRGIDFPYLAVDDSRLVHEPGEYAGLSGRRDGSRDAADLHSDDVAAHRAAEGGDGSRVAMHSMKEFTTMHSNDGDAGGTTLGQPDAPAHHG